VVAETPQEGAMAILKLLEERDYDSLFKKRYSEWYKVEAEGKNPEEAIQKLSSIWERNHDKMVNLFEQLAHAEYELSRIGSPLITETGAVATGIISLEEKKVPYLLYEMKSGLWGFHM
jgi:hypothetical protein